MTSEASDEMRVAAELADMAVEGSAATGKPKPVGTKYDAGKPLADLVLRDFAHALKAVIEVGTFGAAKYDKSNWLQVEGGIERYSEAGMRHKLARWCGELVCSDFNLWHEAHEVWNALAVLELRIREQKSKAIDKVSFPAADNLCKSCSWNFGTPVWVCGAALGLVISTDAENGACKLVYLDILAGKHSVITVTHGMLELMDNGAIVDRKDDLYDLMQTAIATLVAGGKQ